MLAISIVIIIVIVVVVVRGARGRRLGEDLGGVEGSAFWELKSKPFGVKAPIR